MATAVLELTDWICHAIRQPCT